MFKFHRLSLYASLACLIAAPSYAHIHEDTLILSCQVDDQTMKVIVSSEVENENSPLMIYNGDGGNLFSFSNYTKTEQNFKAIYTHLIDGKKKLLRTVDVNRVSGEILIVQKVQSLYGKARSDKNYADLRYEGICKKSLDMQQKF